MKTKKIVLTVAVCIIILAMVGYNYSYSKSKDSRTQEVNAGLEDLNLKVEKLAKEVEDLKSDLNTLKQSSKDSPKETKEIIKQPGTKQAGAELKIGIVSIQRIFRESKKGSIYKEEAIAEQDRIVAELEKLSKEIEAGQAGLKTLKINSSDYMASAKELFEKQANLQARQEFYKQQMELKDQLWTRDLYQSVLRIAGEVAKENSLDLVFKEDEVDFSESDSRELGMSLRTQKLLYSGGCLDITDEVKTRLDAEK